jgi:hypothetical protein
MRPLSTDRELHLTFRCSSWGSSEMGSSFSADVWLGPATREIAPGNNPDFLSLWFTAADLEEAHATTQAIRAQRPPLAKRESDRSKSEFTKALRGWYPTPLEREGRCLDYEYYAVEDVRRWAWFLNRVVPAACNRFLTDRGESPDILAAS